MGCISLFGLCLWKMQAPTTGAMPFCAPSCADHAVLSPSLFVNAGFGFSGRGGQRCDANSYSPGNSYDACQPCPYGRATPGPGLGITAADCKVNLGYGATSDNKTSLCKLLGWSTRMGFCGGYEWPAASSQRLNCNNCHPQNKQPA
jgi:hypothetical protein